MNISDYYNPTTTNKNIVSATGTATSRAADYYNPFGYSDWLKRTTGIKSGFEVQSYNNYLLTWHKTKGIQAQSVSTIRNDYIAFMKTLSLFLPEADRNILTQDMNWDNMLDVEQIIPKCAERLKEITIYFANKREAIKRAKLKYNMTGSVQSVERLFHEYILKAFTNRNHYVKMDNQEIYDNLPMLSSVNNSLKIQIEEVYDNTEYFDKDPEKSVLTYFPMPVGSELEYYNSMGYSESEIEWLFGTGVTPVCADNEMFYTLDAVLASGGGALSAYTDESKETLADYYKFMLSKKYLGEDAYWLSGGYYQNKFIDLTYDLKTGNNWIYFPSGEAGFETPQLEILPVYLSACSLIADTDAVGASTYIGADKIFVKHGDTIDGAWLKELTTEYADRVMSAGILANTPFEFRFPFAGYGISGEGLNWSGPTYSNLDKIYETLEDAEQQAILSAYWDSPTTACELIPISIHDTSLVDCGANSNTIYTSADKITVRTTDIDDMVHDDTPDGVYTGTNNHAWLYRMNNTDLPISVNKNYISWPVQIYEADQTIDIFSVPSSECDKLSLSSVDTASGFIGSRAGYDIFDSDILYKLDARNGTPIECAFLSGVPFTNLSALSSNTTTWTANATGCHQTGLNLKCAPNSYITFMWLDEDTPMDDVSFHIEHQPDCPYLFEYHHSLMKENPADEKEDIDYHQWQKCTCGAIKYSPLGHGGTNYDEYNGFSDVCFLDSLYPIPFSKSTWVSEDRVNIGTFKPYTTSPDFGWYQLTNTAVEPDIGWGKGRWVAKGIPGTIPEQFILRKGYQYKYYRNNIGYDNQYIVDDCVPYLIIRHKHSNAVLNITKPKWCKAIADSSGTWQSTSDVSDMIIAPNDYLVYDHIDSNWYCITGIGTYEEYQDITYPLSATGGYGSSWVNATQLPVDSVLEARWPETPSEDTLSAMRGELAWVNWSVSGTNVVPYTKMLAPDDKLLVYSTSAETFHIGVTGLKLNLSASTNASFADKYIIAGAASHIATVQYLDTTIGTVTSGSRSVETIYADTIGFPLNVQLYGWDNISNVSSSGAIGARPFWGKAYDDDSAHTHQKGTSIWGGGLTFVDDYIPIIQPDISDISISAYSMITYEGLNPIKWIQDITVREPSTTREWCKLDTKIYKATENHINNIKLTFNGYFDDDYRITVTNPLTSYTLRDGRRNAGWYTNTSTCGLRFDGEDGSKYPSNSAWTANITGLNISVDSIIGVDCFDGWKEFYSICPWSMQLNCDNGQSALYTNTYAKSGDSSSVNPSALSGDHNYPFGPWFETYINTGNVDVRKYNFDTTIVEDMAAHTLSSQISDLGFKELIVMATDEISPIVLQDKIDGEPVLVNYWANSDFTWTQRVQDVSDGVAPSGGEYVSPASGTLIETMYPYANMSNRHYPTIASVPIVENFYSKEDVGGYFVPKMLGTSVALAKNIQTGCDVYSRTSATPPSIIRNPEVFAADYGMSKTLNNDDVQMISDDARWLKYSVADGRNAGNIKDPSKYQQFMSYKTDYEIRNENDIGVHLQNEPQDPWTGEIDSTWRDKDNYNLHITKQQPLALWKKNIFTTSDVHGWKSDVYGYNYMLIKDSVGTRIHNKRSTLGKIMIRLDNKHIVGLETVLPDLAQYIVDGDNGLVYDFNVMYNVMIINTNDYTILYKLNYDFEGTSTNTYNECLLINNGDSMFVRSLNKNGVVYSCSGSWFIPNEDKIYVGYTCTNSEKTKLYSSVDVCKIGAFHVTNYIHTDTSFEDYLTSNTLTNVMFGRPTCSYNDKTNVFVIMCGIKCDEYDIGYFARMSVDMITNTMAFTLVCPTEVDPPEPPPIPGPPDPYPEPEPPTPTPVKTIHINGYDTYEDYNSLGTWVVAPDLIVDEYDKTDNWNMELQPLSYTYSTKLVDPELSEMKTFLVGMAPSGELVYGYRRNGLYREVGDPAVYTTRGGVSSEYGKIGNLQGLYTSQMSSFKWGAISIPQVGAFRDVAEEIINTATTTTTELKTWTYGGQSIINPSNMYVTYPGTFGFISGIRSETELTYTYSNSFEYLKGMQWRFTFNDEFVDSDAIKSLKVGVRSTYDGGAYYTDVSGTSTYFPLYYSQINSSFEWVEMHYVSGGTWESEIQTQWDVTENPDVLEDLQDAMNKWAAKYPKPNNYVYPGLLWQKCTLLCVELDGVPTLSS